MIIIDEKARTVTLQDESGARTYAFGSVEGFAAVSRAWLNASWDIKHVYSFTWLGRPVIQLPEDLLRVQEVIYKVRPDVIVETGVAHGGSLVFYASLCEALGHGRVIGIDIEIRPHNRRAIEEHTLFKRIELLEMSSIDPECLAELSSRIPPAAKTMIILDSKHTRDHVLAELNHFAPLVSIGSYIVVNDGIMAAVAGGPRTAQDWAWNNPLSAIDEFLAGNAGFACEEPEWLFNESLGRERVSYWPRAYLRRIR